MAACQGARNCCWSEPPTVCDSMLGRILLATFVILTLELLMLQITSVLCRCVESLLPEGQFISTRVGNVFGASCSLDAVVFPAQLGSEYVKDANNLEEHLSRQVKVFKAVPCANASPHLWWIICIAMCWIARPTTCANRKHKHSLVSLMVSLVTWLNGNQQLYLQCPFFLPVLIVLTICQPQGLF